MFPRCVLLLAMLLATTGSAHARLFGWTYGGGCCVDRYRYFGCSFATGCHGKTCPYKGYVMPRQYCTGTYGLISICCAPCWNVSPGYSFCGNIWSSFLCTARCYSCPRLGYGKGGIFHRHPHPCQSRVCRGGGGTTLFSDSQFEQPTPSGTSHLYGLLYASGPVKGCCGPKCDAVDAFSAAPPTPVLFSWPRSQVGQVSLPAESVVGRRAAVPRNLPALLEEIAPDDDPDFGQRLRP